MAVSRRPSKFRSKRVTGRQPTKPKTGFILTVVDGPNIGKEYFFEKTATVGRVETNDIVLVEPGISRNHARVHDDQGVYILEDMGSANGTRLNGERVGEPEVLRDGDYITLSQTTLQFSQLTAARGEVTAQTTLSEVEALAIDATSTKEDPARARGIKRFLRSRRGKLALLAVLIVLIGLGLYLKQRGKGKLVVIDQSDEPILYSDDDEFFNAVYGYGKYDDTHRYQASFHFEHLGGRTTLQYGAWGVDKVGEVVILLNGKRVGEIPLTMNRWVYGLKLVLPRQLLKKGKTNVLTFKNTLEGVDSWEICYVQIIHEAIPPPDPKEAQAQFDLAKKAWEDRDIEPGNMYAALEGFKRARDLLEALPERPALYQDALDNIEKVDKTLTRRFAEGLFSARRAEKFDGDINKARNVLLRTLRYFQRDDFRYQALQKYLDDLAVQ